MLDKQQQPATKNEPKPCEKPEPKPAPSIRKCSELQGVILKVGDSEGTTNPDSTLGEIPTIAQPEAQRVTRRSTRKRQHKPDDN